ncbi:MAG TPA: NUDIX domain-containing protein [Cytophagaceae bacterium]|jgi:8-oxo-dGTP diphosphatase|nr:NUDIX domain-containing protein [Cytophagaceae bacterium]
MKLQYLEPVASITADCVIFGFDGKKMEVLLIKRGSEPEAGKWALPGGFMERRETLDEAATRVLEQLTGVSNIYIEQFHSFSKIDRHPISRVITVGYYALIDSTNQKLKPSWHASETKWFEINKIPKLGFDHAEIFQAALNTLKKEMAIRPIGFELLPTKFTLTDLQNLYEIILEEDLDRRNFRRKILSMGILTELKEVRKGAHIGATLYKFDKKEYNRLKSQGFSYNL